jgi:hypothetical protein
VAELGVVARALLEIAGDVEDERALGEQVCRAYVRGLDVDGAAISLQTASTSSQTLCATDATAELLEDLQFSLGEGACVEAAVTGRPVLVADMHHSTEVRRWPTFAAAVVERCRSSGERSILGCWTCTARHRVRLAPRNYGMR